MCEHTCCSILFIMMDGVDPKLKSNLEYFWKGFENGFEIKEKKEKKLENKSILKVVKFILESLTKLSIFIWIGKYIWNYTRIRFELGLDLKTRIEKKEFELEKYPFFPFQPSSRESAQPPLPSLPRSARSAA